MLVSIIIPIFNAEEYIEECIESVYQQTYPNIEVILINDCTPDNSMEIVEKIINKYNNKLLLELSNFIILHQKNIL